MTLAETTSDAAIPPFVQGDCGKISPRAGANRRQLERADRHARLGQIRARDGLLAFEDEEFFNSSEAVVAAFLPVAILSNSQARIGQMSQRGVQWVEAQGGLEVVVTAAKAQGVRLEQPRELAAVEQEILPSDEACLVSARKAHEAPNSAGSPNLFAGTACPAAPQPRIRAPKPDHPDRGR